MTAALRERLARALPAAATSGADPVAPIADILIEIPGVLDVQVDPATSEHTHTIIHLRNWHFVDGESFAVRRRETPAYNDMPFIRCESFK